jgi:hypothetical protein
MIDLEYISRRYGLPRAPLGNAYLAGTARVVLSDDGRLMVYASDDRTSELLYRCRIGEVVYRNRTSGGTTLAVTSQQLPLVLELLAPEPDESLPSYGRSGGYGGYRS